MKHIFLASAFLGLAACATTQPYGAATSSNAKGYQTQQIESNRFRVTYTAKSVERARDFALLRAAEVTLENGYDWFEVTNGYTDASQEGGGGIRPSIGVGGTVGSGGYRGGGVGIGIGFPVGGGSGNVVENIEIVTGKGEKPDRASCYDARAVDKSLRGL